MTVNKILNNNNNISHDVCTIKDIRGRESIDILLSAGMSSYIKQPFLKNQVQNCDHTESSRDNWAQNQRPAVSLSLSLSECIHSAPPRIIHTDIDSECLWWRERERVRREKKSIFEDFSSKAVEKISGKRPQQAAENITDLSKNRPETSSRHQKNRVVEIWLGKTATPTLQALRLAAFQREKTAFPAFKGPAS